MQMEAVEQRSKSIEVGGTTQWVLDPDCLAETGEQPHGCLPSHNTDVAHAWSQQGGDTITQRTSQWYLVNSSDWPGGSTGTGA